MKKGISIWSFSSGNLEDKFKLAKRYGFDGVEVELTEDGEINLNSTKEDMLKIVKMSQDCGLQLYSVASGLYWKYCITSNNASDREIAKKIVKKQIDVASWLGCDTILVIPGAVSVSFAPELGVMDYEDAYNCSLQTFIELSKYAEEKNICIGLENVWNKFLLSPLEYREFIDKIGSKFVGSYLDIGNILANGYPQQWIKILGSRIKKVHFKDYRVNVGTLDGFVDLLSGDVNYPRVMEALNAINYDGWVTAEMLPPNKYFTESTIENASNSMNKILGRIQ